MVAEQVENKEQMHDFETVMARLKLSRADVYRQVKDGKLKGEKKDRALVFSETAVAAFESKKQTDETALLDAVGQWEALLASRFPLKMVGDEGVDADEADEENNASPQEEDALPQAPPDVQQRLKSLSEHLLRAAIQENVSDLYIDPISSGDRVLFRYGEALREIGRFDSPLSGPMQKVLTEWAKVPAEGDIRRGVADLSVLDAPFQMLVEIAPTRLGDHIHVHFWGTEAQHDFEALGYLSDQADHVLNILQAPSGLVLVARGADSADDFHHVVLGRELAQNGRLVVSLESGAFPQSQHLVQVQIDRSKEQGFSKALDTGLRLSPDMLMIDVLNGTADIQALFRVLSTGGIVIAGICALDMADALCQIKTAQISPDRVARWVIGGIERVMVRRLCPHCRVKHPLDAAGMAFWKVDEPEDVFNPADCEKCQDGYLARCAVFGILEKAQLQAAWDGATVPDHPFSLFESIREALFLGDIAQEDARHLCHRYG